MGRIAKRFSQWSIGTTPFLRISVAHFSFSPIPFLLHISLSFLFHVYSFYILYISCYRYGTELAAPSLLKISIGDGHYLENQSCRSMPFKGSRIKSPSDVWTIIFKHTKNRTGTENYRIFSLKNDQSVEYTWCLLNFVPNGNLAGFSCKSRRGVRSYIQIRTISF